MSLRRLSAALNHAEQTCLADTAVMALVTLVIKRTPITISLFNTENVEKSAADALQLVTTPVRALVMMAVNADSVHHLARQEI